MPSSLDWNGVFDCFGSADGAWFLLESDNGPYSMCYEFTANNLHYNLLYLLPKHLVIQEYTFYAFIVALLVSIAIGIVDKLIFTCKITIRFLIDARNKASKIVPDIMIK